MGFCVKHCWLRVSTSRRHSYLSPEPKTNGPRVALGPFVVNPNPVIASSTPALAVAAFFLASRSSFRRPGLSRLAACRRIPARPVVTGRCCWRFRAPLIPLPVTPWPGYRGIVTPWPGCPIFPNSGGAGFAVRRCRHSASIHSVVLIDAFLLQVRPRVCPLETTSPFPVQHSCRRGAN